MSLVPRATIAAALLIVTHAASAQCPDGAPPPCVTRAHTPKPTLVVAPFQNLSPDSADGYLAASITDELTAQLRSVTGLRVLTGRVVADYLLQGSVRRVGQALHVSARLQESVSGRIVWTAPLWLPARNLASVPDSIAAATLKAIGVARPVPRARRSASPDVFDLYARGVYQMNRRNEPALTRAVALFQEAIALDSSSALAWSGLARALERANVWRFAIPIVPRESLSVLERAAADRATELEPDNPDVWMMRGRVSIDVDQTSRSAALRAFRRAVALDSSNWDAWRALGLTLMEVDDTSAARVAFERAVAANPGDGESVAWIALYYMWRREYALAARWADSAVSLDAMHTLVRNVSGVTAYERGRMDEAESHFDASRRLSTGPQIDGHTGLARVAARRGDVPRARELLAEALARTDTVNPFVHSPYLLAETYLVLGDTAGALRWLERHRPRRDMHFQMHLRYEPGLDLLRGDLRFQAILSRP